MRSSKLWQSQTFSELIGDGGTTYFIERREKKNKQVKN